MVMQNMPPLIAELAGYTEKERQWLDASHHSAHAAAKL